MDDYSRSFIRGAQNNAYSRRALASDSEVILPTLVHVPGIEPSTRYSTAPTRIERRKRVHANLKKPRALFSSSRPKLLVHLGRGKVVFD